jgi:hypothetical protein
MRTDRDTDMTKLRGEILQLSIANVPNKPGDFQNYVKHWHFILIFDLLLQNELTSNAFLFHIHFITSLFISF